jgi:hypothetical protein
MSRPKTEHGKRVALSVKVSEPTAQAVDARRGILSRAAYLESLIDADLSGFTGKPQVPGRRAAPPARRAAPAAAELARERAREQREDDAAPAVKSGPPAMPSLDRAEQQAVIDDVMTRHADGTPRRKTRSTPAAPHRCPTKGWCGTCNEWKGKR